MKCRECYAEFPKEKLLHFRWTEYTWGEDGMTKTRPRVRICKKCYTMIMKDN